MRKGGHSQDMPRFRLQIKRSATKRVFLCFWSEHNMESWLKDLKMVAKTSKPRQKKWKGLYKRLWMSSCLKDDSKWSTCNLLWIDTYPRSPTNFQSQHPTTVQLLEKETSRDAVSTSSQNLLLTVGSTHLTPIMTALALQIVRSDYTMFVCPYGECWPHSGKKHAELQLWTKRCWKSGRSEREWTSNRPRRSTSIWADTWKATDRSKLRSPSMRQSEAVLSKMKINKIHQWTVPPALFCILQRKACTMLSKFVPFCSLWMKFSKIWGKVAWDDESAAVPRNFWKPVKNRRNHFELLAHEWQIQQPTDWFKVKWKQLDNRARSLLKIYYGGSLHKGLRDIYPDFKWNLFEQGTTVGHDVWKTVHNQRQFFDFLAQKLGLKQKEDWYNWSAVDLLKIPKVGSILKKKYNSSLIQALHSIYPEVDWKPWRFKCIPRKVWLNKNNQRQCFLELCSSIGIGFSDPQKWLNVPLQSIKDQPGGKSLLALYNNNILKLLEFIYPLIDWSNVAHQMSELEKMTHAALRVLFDVEIIPFQQFEFGELDFYLPKWSLGFEVQGEQHFMDSRYRGDFQEQQCRDSAKRKGCEQKGITLIELGYWWDGSPKSLMARIQKLRPDIQFNYSETRHKQTLLRYLRCLKISTNSVVHAVITIQKTLPWVTSEQLSR